MQILWMQDFRDMMSVMEIDEKLFLDDDATRLRVFVSKYNRASGKKFSCRKWKLKNTKGALIQRQK